MRTEIGLNAKSGPRRMERFPFDAATVTSLGAWAGNVIVVGTAEGLDEGEGNAVSANALLGVAEMAL